MTLYRANPRHSSKSINRQFRLSKTSLERKKASIYRQKLEENLQSLKSDLERILSNKPNEVVKPATDETSIISESIISINQFIEECNQFIVTTNDKILLINSSISEILVLKSNIKDYEENFYALNKSVIEYKDKYGIAEDELQISLTININGLDRKLVALNQEKETLEKRLSPIQNNLIYDDAFFKNRSFEQIKDIVSKEFSIYDIMYIWEQYKDYLKKLTSAEQLKYQIYLESISEWNSLIKTIKEGSDSKDGISKYEQELNYVSTKLQLELNELYDQRMDKIENLFVEIQKKVVMYNDIYLPIENKLKDVLNDIDNPISFSSEIVCNTAFNQRVLSYINKSISGDFRGEVQATTYVTNLIKNTDFNILADIKSFVQKFFESIISDVDKTDLLLKERADFYNFLTNLSYLHVEFALQMGNKSLTELSPGERGTVLLVFYLALEKNNCPLIIDQPEDNLDNQSVYKKIVPCILKAKENRQVIVVTHNPNIAVACDSEEIIYSEIDKITNEIRYISGAIEDDIIRQKVIDILEGTKPAFDLRKLKYDM